MNIALVFEVQDLEHGRLTLSFGGSEDTETSFLLTSQKVGSLISLSRKCMTEDLEVNVIFLI